MTRFIDWLRSCGRALMARCAAVMLRSRLWRARARLSPEVRAKAPFWRSRYLAREARLQRERIERDTRRGSSAQSASDASGTRGLSKADVMAAIARSRARREAQRRAKLAAPENGNEQQ